MKIKDRLLATKTRIAALSLLVIGGGIYATSKIVDKLFDFNGVTEVDQDDIDEEMLGI